MAVFIIIIGSFLFFYWLLKIGGLLDNNNKKQEERRYKSKPTYSSKTIRDIPKPQQKEIVVRTLDIPDDNINGTYTTKIAGITHHCDETDQGIFQGIIYLETDNPHNPNAMAIASVQSRKIVGYIPNNELSKYSRWCNFNNCPCVGFIRQFTNEKGEDILFGRVTSIKPCNADFVKNKTNETIVWIETTERMRYTGF